MANIKSYSCLASAAVAAGRGGGGGVPWGCKTSDESPSPSTLPAEPLNTVRRRQIEKEIVDLRWEERVVDRVNFGRWASQLIEPGKSGEVWCVFC